LGVFAFITLLKADPLRPKDPYAGNFGYRHDNFEHPRGRRLARLPAAHRALAAKDRTPLLFITNWLPRGEANGKDSFGSRFYETPTGHRELPQRTRRAGNVRE